MTEYLPLLGVVVVVAGFALKLNAILVVIAAGLASGFAAGKSIGELLELLGTAFVNSRSLLLFTLTLPVIGVLERAGLRERARTWILGFTRLTLSGLLIVYFIARQLLAMVGLIYVAGHPQTVRPLLAPMSEATATRELGPLDDGTRDRVRAMCAATDNVAVFFGEDVFLAFGAVLLIQSFFEGQGIQLDPLTIGLWALPTAGAAFVIHAVRILIFERRMRRQLAARPAARPEAKAEAEPQAEAEAEDGPPC
jgi:uncharacterized membrane protein